MFGEESCLYVLIPASRNLSSRYRCCSYPLAHGEIMLFLIFLWGWINSLRIKGKNARGGTPKAFDLFNRSNLRGDVQRDGLRGGNRSYLECRVLHFQNGISCVRALKMFPLAKIILSFIPPSPPLYLKKRPRANNLVWFKSIKSWNFQVKAAVHVRKPSYLLLLRYIGHNSL